MALSGNEVAHRRWQQARHEELAGVDSWLGLIGLFWLEEGANSLGSQADATIRLPAGPVDQGEVLCRGGRVFWQATGQQVIELQTDRDGQPSTVDLGRYAFFVVDRDGRLAVRLRDRCWAAERPFVGLDCFPYAPAWRIEASWQLLQPALRMEVPNVAGDLKTVVVAQQAVFEVAGERVTLLPMSVSASEVFFVFRDRSSGRETYGAGRFLKAAAAVDGKIVLDFNFAYNPPCAFTAFATCPLPPAENWLGFAVVAGEKKPLL